jgi:outer membrane protein assembly factor BamB
MNRIGILLLVAAPVFGADPWPQWRGPNRDGFARGFQAPSSWPVKLSSQWAAETGEGYSSPVASETRIFLHSRQKDEEIVTCFDRATGKVIWTDRYAAPFTKNSAASSMSKGPFSTPVLADNRLYTLGVTAVLSAYDAGTGKVLWRRQPSHKLDTSNLFFGTGMSMIDDEGRLIVHWGDDDGGEFMALDPGTGKPQWTWIGDGPATASPVVATFNGVRQYVTLTENSVVGISAAKGEALWKIPFKDMYNENIVTPVVHGSDIIVSGVRKPTAAYRIRRAADGWHADPQWSKADVSFYMSSPILDGDNLYGLNNKKRGQLVCIDASTGEPRWTSEGRYAEQAALVAAGPYLAVLTSDGKLKIVERKPASFAQVASYQLGESSTYSHPVLAGKQIFIKDSTHLRAFTLP